MQDQDLTPDTDDHSPKSRHSPKSMLLIAGAAIVAIAASATMYFYFKTSDKMQANAGDPQQVAAGKIVYQGSCASCHGKALEGQPAWRTRKADGKLPAPPQDKTGHSWHHPDEQLFLITRNGVKPPLAPEGYLSDMPAFDDKLSDRQIWDVIAFIKASWPADIRARQKRVNDANRQ